MQITAQPKWLETLSPQSLNSLSSINRRLESGSDRVLVTPFMEDVSDDALIKICEDLWSVEKLEDKLQQIEEENRAKIGPRSIAIPWEQRKESLYAYFRHDGSVGSDDVPGGKLRPISAASAREKLIPTSNSGLPQLTQKRNVLNDKSLEDLAGSYPCVLFTRTAEQAKTRNVWGYPIGDTLLENQYLHAYLQYEKRLNWRSALGGPGVVDDFMFKLFRRRASGERIVCVDFSGFDASVSPSLLGRAFARIKEAFQARYHDELSRIAERIATIPIYTPDGEISGVHGVPSGSSFTNTLDSWVQLEAAGARVDYGSCQVQGDDGVYLDKDPDALLSQFESEGLIVNKEKSDVFQTEEAVYLQRYFSPVYTDRYTGILGGVYPVARALNRIKYLENWTDFTRHGIDGADFYSLRAVMILENCKHHPAFKELVRYVMKWDRNLLTWSPRGAVAYSKMLQPQIQAGVVSSDAVGSGVSLAAHFETTKLLNELRP